MVKIPGHVEGLLHEETQVHDQGVDLTVNEIYEIEEPGRVDFGGGELTEAETTTHERTQRDPEDDQVGTRRERLRDREDHPHDEEDER